MQLADIRGLELRFCGFDSHPVHQKYLMKLATLFQEADIHPDLVPAVDQLTKKCVDKIKAADIGFMPAHESLTKSYGKPGYRWAYSGYGGSPRWLVGYAKMGPTWLGVYLAIDGSLITKKQQAFDTYSNVADIAKGPPNAKDIYEDYYRYYKNIDAFVAYLRKTVKPFETTSPAQRIIGYIKKLPYLWIKYSPPDLKNTKDLSSGLDDKDEFETHGEENTHYGLMSAVSAVAETIASNGSVHPNDLALIFSIGHVKEWLERSGVDIEFPKGQASVRVSPEEVYTVSWQGTYEPIEFSPEIDKSLKNFVTKVANKIINLAQKRVKKEIQ